MPWQRNRSMERVTSEKEKTGGPEAKIPRPGLVFIPYGAQFGSTANFAKSRNFSRNLWRQKVKKNRLILREIRRFCDYGAGLEATTPGL